jgi:hypothetical protein
MRYEIAKKFLAVHRGVPSEPNFTVKLQAEGRQLSVNRESATLFAMKYAISEILFLKVGLGWLFARHVYASYHRRKSPRS